MEPKVETFPLNEDGTFEYPEHPEPQKAIEDAVGVITEYGSFDGEHHKQWVLDQVLRALLGSNYERFVATMNDNEEYDDWDEGIAP